MSKQATAGISQRELARRWGVQHSYVQQLIKRGVIPTLKGTRGRLDPVAADAARSRSTQIGGGARARMTPAAPVRRKVRYTTDVEFRVLDRRCKACNALYSIALGVDLNSPDPVRFCSRSCALDVAAGKTREQIQTQLRAELRADGGWTETELASPTVFDFGPTDGMWNFHK